MADHDDDPESRPGQEPDDRSEQSPLVDPAVPRERHEEREQAEEPGASGPAEESTSGAHAYGYGNAAVDDSPVAPEDDVEVDGETDSETTPQALPGHEPDAQIRPVPGGIARPRARRPAAPAAQPARGRGGRHRGLLVALGAGALVLAVIVGGTALALFGPWRDGGEATSPTAASDQGGSSAGQVTLRDGVTASLVDVQEGIHSIGQKGNEFTPEGEFTAVTITIANESDQPISWRWNMVLVTADGTQIEPDTDASTATDGGESTVIRAGGEAEVTVIFDVPFDADPTIARIALKDGGKGDLALP